MLPLLLKYLPYLIVAAVIAGGSGYATHKLDKTSYEALQAKFSKYQAEVAEANEASQRAYAKALTDEIDKRNEADANNAQVISKLTSEKDNLTAGLVFANRLLSALKAQSPSGSHSVPAPPDQPGTPQAPGGGGDQQIAQLLGAAAAECKHNTEALSALQAELIPQMRKK